MSFKFRTNELTGLLMYNPGMAPGTVSILLKLSSLNTHHNTIFFVEYWHNEKHVLLKSGWGIPIPQQHWQNWVICEAKKAKFNL